MLVHSELMLAVLGPSYVLPDIFAWWVGLLDADVALEIAQYPCAVGGSLWHRLINWQTRLSTAVDRFLPPRYRVYGRQYFRETLVPAYLGLGQTIYDVGGGANPFLSPEVKNRLGARVVGFDVCANELARAPLGSYDQHYCADISAFRGAGDADLIICQSVLEHVRDVRAAFHAFASILKPGGRLLVFVPNRNALFSRLNLLLPEKVKRAILFTVYPHKRQTSGFPAFYDRCTPRDFRALADENGLVVEAEQHFFITSYFFGIFPAYLLWRVWILLGARLFGPQASATFCMVLNKPDE